MSAEVGRWPRPENCRLDLMQVERRRVQRKIGGGGFCGGQHGVASFCGSGSSIADPNQANDWPLWLPDLVEEFLDGFTDPFELSGLRHGKVRIADVPRFARDLVGANPTFTLAA